jgi:hypothetical protein
MAKIIRNKDEQKLYKIRKEKKKRAKKKAAKPKKKEPNTPKLKTHGQKVRNKIDRTVRQSAIIYHDVDKSLAVTGPKKKKVLRGDKALRGKDGKKTSVVVTGGRKTHSDRVVKRPKSTLEPSLKAMINKNSPRSKAKSAIKLGKSAIGWISKGLGGRKKN